MLTRPALASYVPEARAGAVDAVWARARQGYPVVYLTGRPYGLTGMTRGWLDDLGFPTGTVQLVADVAQILPTDDAVGTFKLDYLDTLRERASCSTSPTATPRPTSSRTSGRASRRTPRSSWVTTAARRAPWTSVMTTWRTCR